MTDFTGACDRPADDPNFDQAKNQCAEVTQNSNFLLTDPTGGSLRSNLNQDITERQTVANAEEAHQKQGTFSGGQGGTVDQLSSGVSQSQADQDMNQVQTASGVTTLIQSQDTGDPRCCQTQGTNTADTADIAQTTNQSASDPDAVQFYTLIGECASSGMCHVTQSATVDGGAPDTSECPDPNNPEAPDNVCAITTSNAEID